MAHPAYNRREYRRNRLLLLSSRPPCALCGEPGADTADHIIPKSKGGGADLANLRPAHRSCNSSRGDRQTLRFSAKW